MEKRCRECGKKIENSQTLCDNCRAKRNGKDTLAKYPWWLLGLILPPVGLILYLIWKKDRKQSAKSAGVGALIAAIIWAFVGLSFLLDGKNVAKGPNTLQLQNVKNSSEEIQNWYNDVSSGDYVVTILASSSCPHCKAYKPVITEVAEKEKFKMYFFEGDQLSNSDYKILTSSFELTNYEGSVPYTFIVHDKEFVSDTVGFKDEETTINYLINSGVLEN